MGWNGFHDRYYEMAPQGSLTPRTTTPNHKQGWSFHPELHPPQCHSHWPCPQQAEWPQTSSRCGLPLRSPGWREESPLPGSRPCQNLDWLACQISCHQTMTHHCPGSHLSSPLPLQSDLPPSQQAPAGTHHHCWCVIATPPYSPLSQPHALAHRRRTPQSGTLGMVRRATVTCKHHSHPIHFHHNPHSHLPSLQNPQCDPCLLHLPHLELLLLLWKPWSLSQTTVPVPTLTVTSWRSVALSPMTTRTIASLIAHTLSWNLAIHGSMTKRTLVILMTLTGRPPVAEATDSWKLQSSKGVMSWSWTCFSFSFSPIPSCHLCYNLYLSSPNTSIVLFILCTWWLYTFGPEGYTVTSFCCMMTSFCFIIQPALVTCDSCCAALYYVSRTSCSGTL